MPTKNEAFGFHFSTGVDKILRDLDFQSSLRVGVDKKRIDCPQILSLAAHVFLTCAKICFYSFVI